MGRCKTIFSCLYEPEKKLEADSGCKLYDDKGGLKSYHYGEMLKRLNEMDEKLKKVDNDRDFVGVGRLLRILWRKYEKELTVHTRSLYGGTHEQDMKSKKMKIEGFRFGKNDEGEYGISIDLVYDTYQKDWSKAYQLTFHCFFRNMDYLSNYMAGESFSYAHGDLRFFAFGKNYQFGEVITKEVEDLLGDKAKLDSLRGLPKHDKAPLYDVIFKVLSRNGYSRANADMEQFRHGQACWLEGDESDSADFPKRLAEDAFAHMASCAVANPKALGEMRKCLPDSYEMFIDILQIMVLGLCEHEVDRWKERNERKTWALPKMLIETKRTEGKDEDGKIARDMHFGLKSGGGHAHTTGGFDLKNIGNESVKKEIEKDLEANCSDEVLFGRFEELVKWTSIGSLQTANLALVDEMRKTRSTDVNADKYEKPGEYSNKAIAKAVFEHKKTIEFIEKIKPRIIELIRSHDGNINNINNINAEESVIRKPEYSGDMDMFYGLKIAINDTWGHRITLTDYEYDADSKKFSGKLNIRIFDHFGLDYEDIAKFGTAELVREKLSSYIEYIANNPSVYAPPPPSVLALLGLASHLAGVAAAGFRAWFILQHYRGYRPFVNIMENKSIGKEIKIEGQA